MQEYSTPVVVFEEDLTHPSPLDNLLGWQKKAQDPYFGDVSLVHDRFSGKFLMLRELSGNDRKRMTRMAFMSSERKLMTHPNVLPLVDYSFSKERSFCTTNYFLRQFFENPRSDLRREIERRAKAVDFFSPLDLTLVMYQLLDACKFLQQNKHSHGSISPGSIAMNHEPLVASLKFFYDEPVTSRKYIEQLRRRILSKKSAYPSPTVFEAVSRGQLSASVDLVAEDAFAVGLMLLEAGTFQPTSKLYLNNGYFDHNRLRWQLEAFKKRYEKDSMVLVNCVTYLLQDEPVTRLSFAQILQHMPTYEEIENYARNVRNERTSTMNSTPGDNSSVYSTTPKPSFPSTLPQTPQFGVSRRNVMQTLETVASPWWDAQGNSIDIGQNPSNSPEQFWGTTFQSSPGAPTSYAFDSTPTPSAPPSIPSSLISNSVGVLFPSKSQTSTPMQKRNIFADLQVENAEEVNKFFFPSTKYLDAIAATPAQLTPYKSAQENGRSQRLSSYNEQPSSQQSHPYSGLITQSLMPQHFSNATHSYQLPEAQRSASVNPTRPSFRPFFTDHPSNPADFVSNHSPVLWRPGEAVSPLPSPLPSPHVGHSQRFFGVDPPSQPSFFGGL